MLSGTARAAPFHVAPWRQGSTTVRFAAPTCILGSTSMPTAAVCLHRLHRGPRVQGPKDCAVPRDRAANTTGRGIAKIEKHRTDCRPGVGEPVEHAARH